MKDLIVHFHFEREGLRETAQFAVPSPPRSGDTILLPDGEPGERWTVLEGATRWEFCAAHDEQLCTHVHLRLVLATGQ